MGGDLSLLFSFSFLSSLLTRRCSVHDDLPRHAHCSERMRRQFSRVRVQLNQQVADHHVAATLGQHATQLTTTHRHSK